MPTAERIVTSPAPRIHAEQSRCFMSVVSKKASERFLIWPHARHSERPRLSRSPDQDFASPGRRITGRQIAGRRITGRQITGRQITGRQIVGDFPAGVRTPSQRIIADSRIKAPIEITPLGFEPRQAESKSAVLPLHHGAVRNSGHWLLFLC